MGFEETVVDKVCWFRAIKRSKKLMVLVDCDITNFMTDFSYSLLHCISGKILKIPSTSLHRLSK